MSHQTQVNAHWNAVHDAINMHIRPMYLGRKGALRDKDNKPVSKVMRRDGELIETTSDTANGGLVPIQFVDYNIVQIAQNSIKDLLAEAQEIIGTNSYAQG